MREMSSPATAVSETMQPKARNVRRRVECTALAALLFAPGCSWLLVEPFEPRRASREPDCTVNRAAPVVDTAFVVANLVSSVYYAGQNSSSNKGIVVMGSLGLATIWTISAAYGFDKTSECEAAVDAYPQLPNRSGRPQNALPPPVGNLSAPRQRRLPVETPAAVGAPSTSTSPNAERSDAGVAQPGVSPPSAPVPRSPQAVDNERP